MLNRDFLREFKRSTETKWKQTVIDPSVYGFQFKPGTRWNPGLSDETIKGYENVLSARFPDDFKVFLGEMNGTDLPMLNVYGSCGEPHRESVGVYSYPRDIGIVNGRMEDVLSNRNEIIADLAEQGVELTQDTILVPIFFHRYLACTPNPDSSAVLSIVVNDTDAIVCADSLLEYLQKDFLGQDA